MFGLAAAFVTMDTRGSSCFNPATFKLTHPRQTDYRTNLYLLCQAGSSSYQIQQSAGRTGGVLVGHTGGSASPRRAGTPCPPAPTVQAVAVLYSEEQTARKSPGQGVPPSGSAEDRSHAPLSCCRERPAPSQGRGRGGGWSAANDTHTLITHT